MPKRLRKKRGRPGTGRAPVTGVRLTSEVRANVDKWAAAQPDQPSRSEAIRRLVELGLAVSWSTRRRSQKSMAKALDLAVRQIDKLADASATDEERQQRKRRLLKGPREFRDIRGDISKPKG